MPSHLPTRPESSSLSMMDGLNEGASGPRGYPGAEPEEGNSPQFRRYLTALVRRRWLILGATVLGAAAGVGASFFVSPQYEAQSTLWVEVTSPGSANQGPIRSAELLQSAAWIQLLRSFIVLDPVVQEEKLFIDTSPANRRVLSTLSLEPRFRPGEYKLEISADKQSFSLASDGREIDKGRVGAPIGAPIGFNWQPDVSMLHAGDVIDFTILNPRDVAVGLSTSVHPQLSTDGNFLSLTLAGTEPAKASATLNALTRRYVKVAADLKRDRLDQLTGVLDEQRRYAEDNLRTAEMQLEQFKVQTVTLPSGAGAPVAAGLQMTQDPVMSRYFEMQVELSSLENDRQAIDRILKAAETSQLSLDALSMVPATQKSAGLLQALNERTTRRAELRGLLQRYTPDHPSVRKVNETLADLEERTIPALAGELRGQLANREREIRSQIGSASAELRQIPPRAIEEARLERQKGIAENLNSTLKQRYEEARLAAVSTIPDIRVLDPAVIPTQPVRDTRTMVILMGLVGGFGLAVLGVLAADKFDPRVRYPEQVTAGMGLPILGLVPDVKLVASKNGHDATAHAAESFREIRLNLLHAHGAAGAPMLTITSPGSGDGKSFVSSNLALAFADQGYQTLIIDGDVRRGTLHRTLGVMRGPGLTDYLAGDAKLGAVLQTTKYPNVYLISAGTRMTNGPELLSSPQMSQLLLDLRPRFGAILVDSPPLGAGVDAFALGTMTRNLLLVLRPGTTDRALATAKLEMLDRLPIRLLGVVLNGAPVGTEAYRYYSYIPGYDVAMDEADAVEEDTAIKQVQSGVA